MASRSMFPVRALNHESVMVAGSFAPNGSSAVAAASNKGRGFSAAFTGTGVFTVTLEDAYKDLVSATATLQLGTAADSQVQVGTYTPASGTTRGTVVFNVLTAGSLANIAAGANNRIHFCLVFRNSIVP